MLNIWWTNKKCSSIRLVYLCTTQIIMDFSSHNPRSTNALSLAARQNDIANLRRLLKKINPNCVDNRGWTCLHEAAFNDSLECLQIILRRRNCRPLVESHEGHTALYVACQNIFSTRSIQYLLEKIPDIANYGSREGFTPLHLVSRQGRTDALQLLIDHGAILDVEDFDGDTPLHEACMAKQPEIVNVLLHAGAHPEMPNTSKVTPLHVACSRGCLVSVKYLYPFVTNINALDINGDTPLMVACLGENEDVIEFILEHGGDPNVTNIHGKMAIDLALENGLVKGYKMIFQANDKDALCLDLVYRALSPGYLHIEIIDTILASDLHPDFYMFTKSWMLETLDCQLYHCRSYAATKELSSYTEFAPLTTFLNVAEYIYKLSVEKFDEFFYSFLTKGLSVNASHRDEMPPLVWLLYCPHSTCFDYVLDLLVRFGCDVDYCSEMFSTLDNVQVLIIRGSSSIFKPYEELDLDKMNDFPDAFYASLLLDPDTLPAMLTYSLHCDPGYILRSANEFGVLEQLPTTTISQLMKMIDSDCEINDYEGFKYYIPSLKHLSRLQVRSTIKQTRTFEKTEQYLDLLNKLPLPTQIKRYLRFI